MVDLFYVEDDPNIASVVKEYLEQKDIKVNIYTTLAQARQYLFCDEIVIDLNRRMVYCCCFGYTCILLLQPALKL